MTKGAPANGCALEMTTGDKAVLDAEVSPSTYFFTFRENNMKNLRTLCAACVLAVACAMPASAGYMSMDVAPPPPPTDTPTEATSTNEHTTNDSTFTDTVTGITLALIQIVLTRP